MITFRHDSGVSIEELTPELDMFRRGKFTPHRTLFSVLIAGFAWGRTQDPSDLDV